MFKIKSIIELLLASAMIFVASVTIRHSQVFAQAVISAPGAPNSVSNNPGSSSGPTLLSPLSPVVPAPIPSAAVPGAPGAVGTASALPQLAPAPAIVRAFAAPTPGVFRCSCFGLGSGTRWIGEVTAPTFTQASQSAQAQCTSLLFKENPPSAFIPPGNSGFSTGNGFPAVNPNLPPGNVVRQTGTTVFTERSAASSGTLSASVYCSRCACD